VLCQQRIIACAKMNETVLEGRVNRKRILAAIISVTSLALLALLLPSLHRAPQPSSPVAQPAQSAPSATQAAAAPTTSADKVIPVSVLASTATPNPLNSQATADLSDVDPHKAMGSKNAPIAMEVFSDFQCPACKALFLKVNQKLMDNYVITGKVYLVHRDFPLAMHAYSRIAARYARAAAQFGKGEPVEQALFENQEKWEQNGDVDGTVAKVVSAAEMTKIRVLVKGATLDPLIDKDFALGQGYRVNQTPTTIIHSKGQTIPVVGPVSYDDLKSLLDHLLSQ
jgi:protein-disulfide isomerase